MGCKILNGGYAVGFGSGVDLGNNVNITLIIMGADSSKPSPYAHVTLVNPKELPVLIALDLGYSEEEIYCCYEPGMSGVSLVETLCDFDTTLTDTIVLAKRKSALENTRPEKRKAYEELLHETKQLYFKTLCAACLKRKRNQLALPCCHLLVCEKCCTDVCILCQNHVDDYKHVYNS